MSSGTRTPDPANPKGSIGRRFMARMSKGINKVLHRRGRVADNPDATTSLSDMTRGEGNQESRSPGLGQMSNHSSPVISTSVSQTAALSAVGSNVPASLVVQHDMSREDTVNLVASPSQGGGILGQQENISSDGLVIGNLNNDPVGPATATETTAAHAQSPPDFGQHPGSASVSVVAAPQDNPYLAIGRPPAADVNPQTRVEKAKAMGSVAYEGLKAAVRALSKCSDAFPPLKTATQVFLTITEFADGISENNQALKDLEAKLQVIISIIEKYQQNGGVNAISHRIETFSQAINAQWQIVEKLQQESMVTHVALVQKNAGTIQKALQNIISLCDIFQMDTQLNIDTGIERVLEYMNSGLIDKLNHETTSWKTRTSSYGETTGCMNGTRTQVLEDLDTWASDTNSSKVYWMIGMAGIGKSTIAHSFCQLLEDKQMLGASFFASRTSEKARNARLIIPVIAHSLARSSPSIKSKVVKAIENDPTLAEPSYSNMPVQFEQLIYSPIQTIDSTLGTTYKVVVIDAIDECSNLEVVASFIQLILQSVSDIPLKILISSREELVISNAFKSGSNKAFRLHDIEKSVVQEDICKYLESSLAGIRKVYYNGSAEAWPSSTELDNLLVQCGVLFIYAATAVRYIASGRHLYKDRLAKIARQSQASVIKFRANIDTLYINIVEMACKDMEEDEIIFLRNILSAIVFLCNPLPIHAINSLLDITDAASTLSPLASVIHIPTTKDAPVALFHASFPDFITNPAHCSPDQFSSKQLPFYALDAAEAHQILACRCLEQMNQSLKYNICEIPEKLTLSHQERSNSIEHAGKISEALRYACVYWATHLAEVKVISTDLANFLDVFLYQHLLHWIECLSMLGQLQTGLKSLNDTMAILLSSGYKQQLWLFVNDAYQFLRMNFECIQTHCMEVYQSAFVWIPQKSLVKQAYYAYVKKGYKVTSGLPNLWGQIELVMQNGSGVNCVCYSPNGTHIVSGSEDNIVRIWNAVTGQAEAELKGHTNIVTSVAFSQDGTHIVSGSSDKTVRIWNAVTGQAEAELKDHTSYVTSVAFSQDGTHIVSGSSDKTVRIWNAVTGQAEAELKGHTEGVTSVAFSQDGTHIVSGSDDKTVRIWNAVTGQAEAELKGHTNWVTSVAFSQDGTHIVSGSYDKTVRIWNTITGYSQPLTPSYDTLPDGTVVHQTATGKFRILYPSHLPISDMPSAIQLSDDFKWIITPSYHCWIPPLYQQIYCFSVWNSQICFGLKSGHIILVDIAITS